MINKEIEIDVDKENPFGNCKLDREKYADVLTQILGRVPGGCVIALNGAWGTGKTTFVKMWQQKLKNMGYRTVYYNAWESDFVTDPLIALISEFQGSLADDEKGFLGKVKDSLKKITAGNALNYGSVFLKLLNLGNVAEAIDGFKSAIDSMADQAVDQYIEESKNLTEFKKLLSEVVKELMKDKPLVYFIDELDRCNPHYAVRVLDRIKHLFSMTHIVFVLSIDREQLCHSIRGYYGSEKINADDYLWRFFDFEYNLPEPDADLFFDYLYKKMDFKSIISIDNVTNRKGTIVWKENFSTLAKNIFRYSGMALRLMEKIMNLAWLAMQSTTKLSVKHGSVFILLIYLRYFKSEIYQKIKERKYDIQDLVTDLETMLPCGLFHSNDPHEDSSAYSITYAIINLVMTYDNAIHSSLLSTFYIINNDDVTLTNLNVTKMKEKIVKAAILDFNRAGSLISFQSVIDQIELTQKLVREV